MATLGTTAPSRGRSLAAHCGRRDSRRARRGSVWAARPRGWAGPGPHLDPTSAPSHILAAQVTGGGGGSGELRTRRGRGSRSAHRRDGAVTRPRLGRRRGRGQGRTPLALRFAAGPIRTERGAHPASGRARADGRAPLAGGRRGGNWSPEPGTLTHDVRGRRAGAGPRPLLSAAGTPRGIFLSELLYRDSLEPRRGDERSEGCPFVPLAPPVLGAAESSPCGARLRFSLSSPE